ncbi:MAG: tRNA lysidine(34) synthetase TilS [Oscillospiraceae bacterium]
MNKTALDTISQYNMIKNGDKIVIGLSGGADSIALTLFLLSIKDKYSLSLSAAHINHCIRGDEAKRDEDFVKEFCVLNDLKLNILNFDIPLECKKTGESEEECGRRIRYSYFSEIAGKGGKIATAHNLNDNAETVLLNIIRGTGNKGICGIPPIRDNIIRPLILCSREKIEEYLKSKNQSFITDSTNLVNDYKRNKIRNTVFPILKEINPSFLDAFERLVLSANDDEELLKEICNDAYKTVCQNNIIDENELIKLPKSIKKRVIARFLSENTSSKISAVHINDVIDIIGSNKKITSAGSLKIQSKSGFLKIQNDQKEIEPFEIKIEIKSQSVKTPQNNIQIQILSQKDLQNLNKELLANCIDCDRIINTVFLRSRKDADEITLAKRNVTKSLKKLFNEAKIETFKRNGIAVLSSGDEVLWVEGFGTSKKYLPSKMTKKIMLISKG